MPLVTSVAELMVILFFESIYLYDSEKLTIQGVYTIVAEYILYYLKTKRHNNWIVNRYATPLNGQFHMFFPRCKP